MKKIKNKFQYENYAKKLKSLQRELKKQKKITDQVVEDNTATGIKVTDHQHVVTSKLIEPKENIYHMDALIELFSYAHQIHDNKNFREYLRLFFIRVSGFIEASDFIVFTQKNDMLYHYKKRKTI